MDYVLCVALHRESLPSAGRAVNEDSAILPIDKSVAKHAAFHFGVYFLLGGFWVENLFEAIYFLLSLIGSIAKALPHNYLRLVPIDN